MLGSQLWGTLCRHLCARGSLLNIPPALGHQPAPHLLSVWKGSSTNSCFSFSTLPGLLPPKAQYLQSPKVTPGLAYGFELHIPHVWWGGQLEGRITGAGVGKPGGVGVSGGGGRGEPKLLGRSVVLVEQGQGTQGQALKSCRCTEGSWESHTVRPTAATVPDPLCLPSS